MHTTGAGRIDHIPGRSRLFCWVWLLCLVSPSGRAAPVPSPLLSKGHPVGWWFAFKFNSESFSGCGGNAQRSCLLGGTVQEYTHFGQQFAYASSNNPVLQQGTGCLGDTTADPVGATASQVYKGKYYYVLWNDQFDGDPLKDRKAPAGHSKGMLAWDKRGEGFVMQVSTPSWPASGSSKQFRKSDGNTLGCVRDNNVMVSQHFFSLKLTRDDVVMVLKALANSSAVTDPAIPQIVRNGGPPDIKALVGGLGKLSAGTTALSFLLSSGVRLVSKPSHLNTPPWQLLSALLDGEPLRAATWRMRTDIPTTTGLVPPGCWNASLGIPGAVEIATAGTWAGKRIGLEGSGSPNGNHAKIGVSTGTHSYAIFGDLNQQGSLDGPDCESSQNGRGGLFFVVEDASLFRSVRDLIAGETAPLN